MWREREGVLFMEKRRRRPVPRLSLPRSSLFTRRQPSSALLLPRRRAVLHQHTPRFYSHGAARHTSEHTGEGRAAQWSPALRRRPSSSSLSSRPSRAGPRPGWPLGLALRRRSPSTGRARSGPSGRRAGEGGREKKCSVSASLDLLAHFLLFSVCLPPPARSRTRRPGTGPPSKPG